MNNTPIAGLTPSTIPTTPAPERHTPIAWDSLPYREGWLKGEAYVAWAGEGRGSLAAPRPPSGIDPEELTRIEEVPR